MILGIQISRRAYLKTLGPVIDEALRRSYLVFIVLDRPARKPGAEPPRLSDFQRWPGIRLLTEEETRFTYFDAVVGMALERSDWIARASYFCVGEFWDNLLIPPRPWMTYTSDYHWQTHYRVYGISGTPPPVVGWVPGDQVQSIDLERFVKKYNLPTDERPIWTVFPPKEAMPQYREIVRAITERAKKDGAYVIIRMRPKAHERWWMRWQGNKRIWDDQMIPNASLACLLLSDLAIHFTSGVAFEAAYVGCPAVSIGVTKPPAFAMMGDYYAVTLGTRLQWPGVNEHVSQALAPAYLRDASWPVLRGDARQDYIRKFLLSDDGKASSRLLDLVERA